MRWFVTTVARCPLSHRSGNIEIKLEHRGTLILKPSDHIATGGEGAVYRATNTIIKLYTDGRKMDNDGTTDKIKLLSAIKHKFIVSPVGLVADKMGNNIGYYMAFADGEPLPRVFTNDFRTRKKFSDKHATILVDNMRQVVEFAHANNALLVDANEMNWIVSLANRNIPEPRVIDIDSWQIGRFHAKVIMPSIRDWNSSNFTQLTDWFSWGIVTFQIYCGIHPYKGTLGGYKPNDIETRMKAKASVFSTGIQLNRAVRDFSSIPGPLLDWYVAAFQNGERTKPPSPLNLRNAVSRVALSLQAVTTTTGLLVYERLLKQLNERANRVFPCGVVLFDSGKLYDIGKQKQISSVDTSDCEITKVENGWLKSQIINHRPVFSFINDVSLEETELTMGLAGGGIFRSANRIFILSDNGITEVVLRYLNKPLLAIGNTWETLVNSTLWFDGVGIQDAMGATYLIVPFGDAACAEIRVPELDGLRHISAKAGSRFVTIASLDRRGNYQKSEIILDREYKTYKINQETIVGPDINLAILPKGVCASIVKDGELNIYVPTTNDQNIISDKNISTDMLLFNWDNKVIYLQNGEIWSIKTK